MNSPVARRMPLLTAAPFPLLYGCVTTVAPDADATVDVASFDPSSTTMISCHGAAAFSAPTTLLMASASLYAGMTMDTADGSATRLALPARFARQHWRWLVDLLVRQLEHADAIQQVLEQLSVAGDHVRDQADNENLE